MFSDQHFLMLCFSFEVFSFIFFLFLATDRAFPHRYGLLDAFRHAHIGLFAQSPGCHLDNCAHKKDIDQYRAAFCVICDRM